MSDTEKLQYEAEQLEKINDFYKKQELAEKTFELFLSEFGLKGKFSDEMVFELKNAYMNGIITSLKVIPNACQDISPINMQLMAGSFLESAETTRLVYKKMMYNPEGKTEH